MEPCERLLHFWRACGESLNVLSVRTEEAFWIRGEASLRTSRKSSCLHLDKPWPAWAFKEQIRNDTQPSSFCPSVVFWFCPTWSTHNRLERWSGHNQLNHFNQLSSVHKIQPCFSYHQTFLKEQFTHFWSEPFYFCLFSVSVDNDLWLMIFGWTGPLTVKFRSSSGI